MMRHAHLGVQLALSTGLFMMAGWWLDGRVGTRPLLTIAGAMLGAAAGFYSLIHQLLGKPRGGGKPPGGTGGDPEREGED